MSRIPVRILLLLLVPAARILAGAEVPDQCPLLPVALLDHRDPTCSVPATLHIQDTNLDDLEDESQWAPWSYDPECSYSKTPEDLTYCVFSLAHFDNGRGVSLITTPEIAESLLPTLQSASSGLPAHHHSGHSPSSQTDADSSLPFVVKSMPGKGVGVLATRKIARGEIIMKGLPAVIVNIKFAEEGKNRKFFNMAFERLGDKQRMVGLAKSLGGQEYEDVIKTNGFGTKVGGMKHTALFPEIARINHGCLPNAHSRLSEQTLVLNVIALRDLEPGEEILISYITQGLPTNKRRHMLLRTFGFECLCPLCTAPPTDLDLSDAQRSRILDILDLLRDQSKTTYDDVLRLTTELIELAKREQLTGKMRELYHELMKVHYDWQDVDGALRYARLALKYAEEFDLPDEQFVGGLRENVRALESYVT